MPALNAPSSPTPAASLKFAAFKEILTTLRALAASDDRIIEYFRWCPKVGKETAVPAFSSRSTNANARGFRNFKNYHTRILFFCGKLPLAS